LEALAISIAMLFLVLGGAALGFSLRPRLPQHHLSSESLDVVKVGTGLMATLAALVIGFLVASANTSLRTKTDEVQQLAADIVILDRTLRLYGPETQRARDLMRELLVSAVDRIWKTRGGLPTATVTPPTTARFEQVQELLINLAPATEAQRFLRARALQLSDRILQTRWLLQEQTEGSIPMAFLVILLLWLIGIATSLGLFAPRNGTVRAVIAIYAFSVASAVFLILSMDRPFGGILRISEAPMRSAITFIEQP
jgi:hypothetical protein